MALGNGELDLTTLPDVADDPGYYTAQLADIIQNALPSWLGGSPLTQDEQQQLAGQMAANMTKAATDPETGELNQDLISQMLTQVPNTTIFQAATTGLPGAGSLVSNVPWGPNNPQPANSGLPAWLWIAAGTAALIAVLVFNR